MFPIMLYDMIRMLFVADTKVIEIFDNLSMEDLVDGLVHSAINVYKYFINVQQ